MRLRTALVVAAVQLVWAPLAHAGDPIMPVSQVQPGMKCTGYTVIRGTEISSFDVEVVDVVDQSPYAPSILVRVSGPAVANSGVAAGFSGSPVYCRDGQGTDRVIGAIAEVVGDYGNNLAIATSIEEILSEPVDPPRARPARLRSAQSRRVPRTPLTVSGLSGPVERALVALGRRGPRPVIASPRAPAPAAPFVPLRPGSSVSVGLSSGDLWVGGIGTVSYVDGNSTWVFGHPFEAVGRRSLLMQEAYVHTVVANPDPTLGSYKLASPGLDIGTITNDGLAAVVGSMGTVPGTTDVNIEATDLDRGERQRTSVQVADESAVDTPSGFSPLQFIGPLAVADASVRIVRSIPARETGSMCATLKLAGHAPPVSLCNRYVVQFGGGIGGGMADDLARAIQVVDDAEFERLSVETLDVAVEVERGAQQARLLGATMPRSVRRGSTVAVSLRARVLRGPIRRFRFNLRIPRRLSVGTHTLTLSGPETDEGGELGDATGDIILFDEEDDEVPRPARSFGELESQIAALERWDGVVARFSGRGGTRARAYRDADFRIGGEIKLRLRVRR